jgi:signal transduction histidine kinase
VIGVVRITQSVDAVHSAVRGVLVGLALLAGVVLVLGLGAGSLIAGQIARPLRRLEAVARTIAGGALDARAPIEGSSEQRSLGRSFNEMAERVSRMLGSQRAFVADASHQLRTPLTGLRLRLEEAEALGVSDAVRAELHAGLAQLDRLSHTVDELLVLSRADDREAPGEDVPLREVIADAAERWGQAAARRSIGLDVAGGPGAAVWCNREDLDRALDVLVENAILYSPGGTTVTIRTAGSAIEVLDEGPGVTDVERELVFERFARGRAAGDRPGTGLGLPIARTLMDPWGAEVTLGNGPQGGALARIAFPNPSGALPGLNPRAATVSR